VTAPAVPPVTARPLLPSDRLALAEVAVRTLGDDLLVALPDPSRPVERLSGSGPLLWTLLGSGCTLGEAAATAAGRAGVDPATVLDDVVAFAESLVATGLARRA
jgi:hypothetical protein